jgi:hypothetical protein
MTDRLTLEESIALAIRRTMQAAFPTLQVVSWDAPEDRQHQFISFRVDNDGENPIGTNIHDITISFRASNLDGHQRELFRSMVGTAHDAKETLQDNNNGKFSMPLGQPVELVGISHETENQTDRIITVTLSASVQPI